MHDPHPNDIVAYINCTKHDKLTSILIVEIIQKMAINMMDNAKDFQL